MAPVRIASVSGLRGIVGNGLDPLVATAHAAAFANTCDQGSIVVGHDGRPSAHVFIRSVLAAVAAAGRDALHAGAIATPTLAHFVRSSGAAGGVLATASHNPPEYNGLKCFGPAGRVVDPAQGARVLQIVEAGALEWATWDRLGKIADCDEPEASHLNAILGVVDAAAIRRRGFRVVLDSNHGAGGRLGQRLLDELGCQVLVLGPEPDGAYDHAPEPTEANLRDLPSRLGPFQPDVIFAQDPDADRLAILDETGRYIGEELTLALAVEHRLTQETGPVVANLSTSRVIDLIAARHGAGVERSAVGEYHVVTAMRAINALIGGEGNGGVIDPRVGFVRDSFVAMALVLELMAARAQPLSRIVDELPQLVMIKTKFSVKRRLEAADFERVERALCDAAADHRDGLRLDWPDRWVHMRGSNTEPIIRVIAEGESESAARGAINQVAALLGLDT